MKRWFPTVAFALMFTTLGSIHAQSLSEKLRTEGRDSLAQAALKDGNAIRGAVLFPQQHINCAKCHASAGGSLLGPDLTQLPRDTHPEYLVEAILNPSKDIKPEFVGVSILLKDGRTYSGRIIEQNDDTLQLRQNDKRTSLIVLRRDQIDELVKQPKSLMPDNLVDQLASRQQFLDLVRYMIQLAENSDSSKTTFIAGGGKAVSDTLQGLQLIDEMGCLHCHRESTTDSSLGGFLPYRGPDLRWSAQHTNPYYLERFIRSPQTAKPGARMPHLLSGSDDEQDAAASALTHYLLSQAEGNQYQPQPPDPVAAKRGEERFHHVGCVTCHAPRQEDGSEIATPNSTPLGDISNKYNLTSLTEFLKAPHQARPAGRMPQVPLSHWEAQDIGQYLLQSVRVQAPLRYTLYRGQVNQGIEQLSGKEDSAGVVEQFTLEPFAELQQDYAVRYTGFLRIDQPGEYRFRLRAADAARLVINGREIAAFEPSAERPDSSQTASIELAAGWVPIELTYAQIRKAPLLQLEIAGPDAAGPDVEFQPIPAARLRSINEEVDDYQPIQVDSTLAEQGHRLYQQLSCASCHEAPSTDRSVQTPVLSKLNLTQGCLSDEQGKWPQFQLAPDQKQLIVNAWPLTSQPLDQQQRINLTLSTLNCLACHQRNELGGVTSERNSYFHSTNENLGEQGRIPPPLTGVGAKLKPKWLRQVLVSGKRIRPYMKTRMPLFGPDNVTHLVDLFAAVDPRPAISEGAFSDLKEFKKQGAELVGNQGFNCIACHTFQQKPALTMPGVDLTEMAERLHKEWFYTYLLAPQKYRRNTVMPTFWPGGTSMRADLLDGDTAVQIEALWQYLQDGRQARTPRGLIREPIRLVAGEREAVMLRRNYPGIGKRGIGVGLPSQFNYAFDAEQMRLATVWKGEFADPGAAWMGQGSGTVRPLGSDQIQFPKGPDLDDPQNPWVPDEGRPPLHQFLGYTLDKQQRPTLEYRFGSVRVRDKLVGRSESEGEYSGLRRTLTLSTERALPAARLRLATAEQIQKEGDNRFRVGDSTESRNAINKLRIAVQQGPDATIVKQLTTSQLELQFELPVGETTLIIDYLW